MLKIIIPKDNLVRLVRSKDLKVVIKPDCIEDLKQEGSSSSQAEHHSASPNPKKIMFQSNDKCVFVNISDIIMITRSERKTVIFTSRGPVKICESLQQLESRLDSDLFFRCHKGFIVNTDKVTEISPWGNKTYLVKLANTSETALMTFQKAKQFKVKYCVE